MHRYNTRNHLKALALVRALIESGYNTAMTTLSAPATPTKIAGFSILTMATETEFKNIRMSIADQFPSSNPSMIVPENIDVPDTLPADWTE